MIHWNFTPDTPFIAEADATIEHPIEGIKMEGIFVWLCLEGEAEIRVDTRNYKMVRHSQIVIMPGSSVESGHISDDFKMLQIGCEDHVFQEITSSFEPTFFHYLKDVPCVVIPDADVDMLKKLTDLTASALEDFSNSYRRQMVCNYIQNVLYHFYGRTHLFFKQTENKWVSRKEELFKDYLQLVHQHCTTQRDVSFYASKMNISPRYLSAIVLKTSGETAKSIIDRHVITEIKVALKNSRMNMQEISHQMNFINPSFFSRYFKKHTGMSPLQYRNEV